jgi:hypothetical protein
MACRWLHIPTFKHSSRVFAPGPAPEREHLSPGLVSPSRMRLRRRRTARRQEQQFRRRDNYFRNRVFFSFPISLWG